MHSLEDILYIEVVMEGLLVNQIMSSNTSNSTKKPNNMSITITPPFHPRLRLEVGLATGNYALYYYNK